MVVGLPSTRREAVKLQSVSYFTGHACSNGHTDKRYTNTGICYECKRLQAKRDYVQHSTRIQLTVKKSYKKHRIKRLINAYNWANRNRERSRKIKRAWKDRNRNACNMSEAARARKKRATDPFWRLNKNTCKAIWDGIRKRKAGRHWELFVEFTLAELIKHLQSLFTTEMTWDNYGSFWEIDHIKPLSLCTSFEEAWKLANLQPLKCSVNRSKGNRYIG